MKKWCIQYWWGCSCYNTFIFLQRAFNLLYIHVYFIQIYVHIICAIFLTICANTFHYFHYIYLIHINLHHIATRYTSFSAACQHIATLYICIQWKTHHMWLNRLYYIPDEVNSFENTSKVIFINNIRIYL